VSKHFAQQRGRVQIGPGNRNMRPTLRLAIACLVVAAQQPTSAADQPRRFVEIRDADDTSTRTHDLNSVELIQPDKFTIRGTDVADPDIIVLQMKALDTLRTYCGRRDGDYDAPAELLTLGTPDLAIEKIKVKSEIQKVSGKEYPRKSVLWKFPYDRLASHGTDGRVDGYPILAECQPLGMSPDEWYWETRSAIMDGFQIKEMYDCRRFVMGTFAGGNASKAITFTPSGLFVRIYTVVCHAVTGKLPYLPE
jgi:hypothetical protein